MSRKFIDCREYPSEMNCTVFMSADSEDELLEAAVQHALQKLLVVAGGVLSVRHALDQAVDPTPSPDLRPA